MINGLYNIKSLPSIKSELSQQNNYVNLWGIRLKLKCEFRIRKICIWDSELVWKQEVGQNLKIWCVDVGIYTLWIDIWTEKQWSNVTRQELADISKVEFRNSKNRNWGWKHSRRWDQISKYLWWCNNFLKIDVAPSAKPFNLFHYVSLPQRLG